MASYMQHSGVKTVVGAQREVAQILPKKPKTTQCFLPPTPRRMQLSNLAFTVLKPFCMFSLIQLKEDV